MVHTTHADGKTLPKSRRILRSTECENETAASVDASTNHQQSIMANPLAPLPDELILEICEQLDDFAHERHARVAFAALARTCRYLYPFGMRYLYRTYSAGSKGPIRGFLQRVFSSTRFSVRPQKIHFDATFRTESSPSTYNSCTNVEELSAKLHGLSLPYEHTWIQLFATIPESIDLGLLILLSRESLQALEITDISGCLSDIAWLDPILHAAHQSSIDLNTNHGFHMLKRITLGATELSTEHVYQIMLLPSLRFFNLDWMSTSSASTVESLPPGSSLVENIHFHVSSVSSDVISGLVAACKTVKSFRYTASSVPSDQLQWYTDVIGALRSHCKTLELLVLDTSHDSFMDLTDRFPPTRVFAEMCVLKHLEINFSVIMGKPIGLFEQRDRARDEDVMWKGFTSLPELLPPNLEVLVLDYERSALPWDIDYDDQLLMLLMSDFDFLRTLHSILINYSHDDAAGEFPLHLWTLEQEFAELDIDFVYNISYYVDEADGMDNIVQGLRALGREGFEMLENFEDMTDGDDVFSPSSIRAELRAASGLEPEEGGFVVQY
ncbi:hypothetical protein P153DRAFT_430108 [Dothidotthia symphoricarpi CBS 119687]|uniref:F-box domain-containing protein n=1 Tax=Dothidotthia symphoricarpi CBS 119687 TaxID=1392245 RepID=A0A6A6AFN7_9PLEO|nr:uncharacterized protein P153DRAFT_430108 [Dothidotthia symphoricarpi CBS 119687]KAF2130782.1 hypothetical protein P153DRAFT_430108 [Dothidotthia symphoricarpi CBS 119687]